jgi:hypothetical protein
MNIKSTKRAPNLISNPQNVQSFQKITETGVENIDEVVSDAISQKAEKDDTTKLKDLVEGIGAGGVSKASLEMFKVGRNVEKTELVNLFKEYNFTPEASDNLADSTLKTVNSVAGKSVFLGLAGGSAMFGILEVVKPGWSLKKRVMWSLAVAIVTSLIYLLLVKLGFMQ